MKVVILAGGLGTRIAEETQQIPKPLIEVGGMPILLHVMKIYSKYGINDFVICCGYKGNMIKDYFLNYFHYKHDPTFDFKNNAIEISNKDVEPWKVTLVDTGLDTQTGGRLLRVKNYLEKDTFCLTYADDLKNVNIEDLINFHRMKKKLVTITATKPPPERFGILKLENENVLEIKEKPSYDDKWINGGYYVLEPQALDYIKDDLTIWEKEPLEKLVNEGNVAGYRYYGPYQPLDTLQDKKNLERLWNSGNAYWKVWK